MQRKTRTKGQIVSLLGKISLFDVFSQLQTPSTKQSTWKSKYVGTRYRLYFKLGDGGRLILTDSGSKTEIERAWIVHETWNNHRGIIYLVNDRNRNFRPKPRPKPKQFRFGFGSVILTETETTFLTFFWTISCIISKIKLCFMKWALGKHKKFAHLFLYI